MPKEKAIDPRQLEREVEALQFGLEQITLESEGDPAFIRDSFDGLMVRTKGGEKVTFEDVLKRLHGSNILDDVDVIGLKQWVADFNARKQRAEKRIEKRRGLIHQLMAMAGRDSVSLDIGTFSLGSSQGAVEIDPDREYLIPTKYWKRADPTLDKTALKEAIKSSEELLKQAFSVMDPVQRAQAVFNVVSGFPHDPDREIALREVAKLNDPDAQLAELERIVSKYSPVPGANLVKTQTLTVRSK